MLQECAGTGSFDKSQTLRTYIVAGQPVPTAEVPTILLKSLPRLLVSRCLCTKVFRRPQPLDSRHLRLLPFPDCSSYQATRSYFNQSVFAMTGRPDQRRAREDRGRGGTPRPSANREGTARGDIASGAAPVGTSADTPFPVAETPDRATFHPPATEGSGGKSPTKVCRLASRPASVWSCSFPADTNGDSCRSRLQPLRPCRRLQICA